MAAPGTDLGPLQRIEEPHLSKLAGIAAGRDQLPAIRAEGEAANLVLKTTQGRLDLPGRWIDQLDFTVAPDREQCPIRTEGERTHCGPHPLR